MPMPAPRPARTPRKALWLWCVTAKATMAPTDMMPSAPRFSTPDFSVTSSPRAVMTSGVPATMVSKRMEVKRLCSMASRAPFAEAGPEVDEHVRAEQEEKQESLEHLGDGGRQVHVLLG